MPIERSGESEGASVQVTPAPADPNTAPPATPAATPNPQEEPAPVTPTKSLTTKIAGVLGALASLALIASVACNPVPSTAPNADSAGLADGAGVQQFSGTPTFSTSDDTHAPQQWHAHLQVDKRLGDWTQTQVDAGLAPAPYEIVTADHNLLLTRGAQALWDGLSGVSVPGGAYNTTNAALAVSDAGSGAAAANIYDADVAAGATTAGTGVSAISCTTGTATYTTSAVHGLVVGQVVTITSVVPANTTTLGGSASDFGYNGTFAVATVPTTTTFTAAIGPSCPAAYTSGGTVKTASTVGTPTALSESSTTVTVTVANSLTAGQVVQILGATPSGYNGTWVVASATGTSFTYTNTASGLGAGTVFGPVLLYNKYRQQANGTGSGTVGPSGGVNANALQYVATFGTTSANYAWNDWALDNSGTSQAFANLFNHAFPGGGLGTKTSAASWTLTVVLSEN